MAVLRYFLFVLLLHGSTSVFADTHDASELLNKMSQSMHRLNYDGVFIFSSGSEMDTMRIIHRASGTNEQERLVSLSGTPREVLRDNDSVTCILSDSQAVVVDKSRPKKLFPVLLAESIEQIARTYNLSAAAGSRIAGRETTTVYIRPKDTYRYGHRYGLDRETGLLLSSELISESGRVLERIVFANISIGGEIKDAALEPSIPGKGYTWFTSEGETRPRFDNAGHWQITWLPDGFSMQDHELDPIPTSKMPVEHLVFSDGLASVSVFIEEIKDVAERQEGISSMGAINAFGTMIERYQVTVVGEVPPETVMQVGKSVQRKVSGK